MSFFSETATHEDKLVIARHLSGEALVAGVRACVRQGDVESLKLLIDAGRFRLRSLLKSDLTGRREVILTVGAPPLIDALGDVLEQRSWDRTSCPTSAPGHDVLADQVRVQHAQALLPVLRSLCEGLAPEFDQLLRGCDSLDVAPDPNGQRFKRDHVLHWKQSTALVFAVLGCAMDDPRLVHMALDLFPDCLHGGVSARGIHTDPQADCRPLAFAIRYGSVNVLKDHELQHSLAEPLVWDGETDTELITNPLSLLAENDDIPEPEPVRAMVPLFFGSPGMEQVLKDAVQTQICGGSLSWLHLAEPILAARPQLLNDWREELLDCAFKHGHAWLAEKLLAANDEPWFHSRFEAVAPAEEQGGWSRLRVGHPAFRATQFVDAPNYAKTDVDGMLLMVFQKMKACGRLEDAWRTEVVHPGGMRGYSTVAHICASHALPLSLQFLAENGMDLDVRDPRGKTLIEAARESGAGQGWHQPSMAPIIEAMRARRLALAVLANDDLLAAASICGARP